MIQNLTTGNCVIVGLTIIDGSLKVTLNKKVDFYCTGINKEISSSIIYSHFSDIITDSGLTLKELIIDRIEKELITKPEYVGYIQKNTRDWQYPEWLYRIHLTHEQSTYLSINYKSYFDSLYEPPKNPMVITKSGVELYVDTIPAEMVPILSSFKINIDINPNPNPE